MSNRAVRAWVAAVIAVATVAPGVASAHFTLTEPACYSEQDGLGSPQKSAPCGQADPGDPAVPTDAVTTLIEGGTLTLTIDETIFHPGHYRVAIAPDMDSLPDDPPVTVGSTPCGATVIDPDPELPILADGVFVHTARFTEAQTIEIALPPGFTCERCVVQVIEFMSNHGINDPGGCFYHHCAEVTVAPASDAGAGDDAGVRFDASTGTTDAGTTAPAASGCGCRVTRTPSAPSIGLAALIAFAWFFRRRG